MMCTNIRRVFDDVHLYNGAPFNGGPFNGAPSNGAPFNAPRPAHLERAAAAGHGERESARWSRSR